MSKAQDILLVPAALVVTGLGVAAFVWPRFGILRLAAIAATAGLVGFVYSQAVEFAKRDFTGVEGDQAGEVVALIATGLLVAALVVQLVDVAAAEGPSLPLLTLIGLIAFALAGLLQPLAELLPIAGDSSVWETFTAADLIRAFVGLATTAAALAALLVRQPGVVGAAFALGCYTATDNVVASIEAFAADANGAEPFVSLLLLAPLGIAAAVLVATGSRAAFSQR